jgi:hypothetical protein
MFAKSKITQSMIDAVNSVITEDKNRTINDVEIEEASEKVPTSTGMKVYGHRYGDSAKARRDQTKHSVDDVKEPKAKDLKEDELTEDGDCVTKPQAKDIAKKEVKGHEKKMHKEGMSFSEKLLTMYEQKTAGTDEVFTDNNIGESEMSDAQMKKREKIVMSMKKGEAGFKQRYGKNWKNVMYATATKQAMKEDSSDVYEGEELDEGRMKDIATNDAEDKRLGSSPKKGTDIADKAYLKHKPGTVKGTMTQLGRFLRGKPEIKEDVGVQVDKKSDKITTDMLSGRVTGGKVNAFKNYKVDLKTSSEEPVPVQVDKGEDTREKQKITTNPGAVDVKFDDKLGHPTVQSHFSSEHQITHEEVQVDEKVIAGTPGWEKIKGADTKGNIKDKSGAVHTPMSRAKDLARQAFKKIKTETMMGKISN